MSFQEVRSFHICLIGIGSHEEIKENPIYLTLNGNSNAMRRLGPKTRKAARHIVGDLLSEQQNKFSKLKFY